MFFLNYYKYFVCMFYNNQEHHCNDKQFCKNVFFFFLVKLDREKRLQWPSPFWNWISTFKYCLSKSMTTAFMCPRMPLRYLLETKQSLMSLAKKKNPDLIRNLSLKTSQRASPTHFCTNCTMLCVFMKNTSLSDFLLRVAAWLSRMFAI